MDSTYSQGFYFRILILGIVPFFTHKVNPRTAYTTGQFVKTLAMLCTGLYLHLHQLNPEITRGIGWIPLVMFVVIFLMRGIAIKPVRSILLSELFPTEIRTLAISICQFFQLGSGALLVKLYPNMRTTFQRYGLCYLYAVFGLFSTIWAHYTIPDNRSKSLVEIERFYDDKTPLLSNKRSTNK